MFSTHGAALLGRRAPDLILDGIGHVDATQNLGRNRRLSREHA